MFGFHIRSYKFILSHEIFMNITIKNITETALETPTNATKV